MTSQMEQFNATVATRGRAYAAVRAVSCIAAAVAIGALLHFAPRVGGWLIVVVLFAPLLAGLAVSAAVEPLPRLKSMLLQHVGWLLRFVSGAVLLGISAGIAVTAQAEWDAAAGRGVDAQAAALLGAIGEAVSVAATLGIAFLAVRLSFDLWRGGVERRRKASLKLQLRLLDRPTPLVTKLLVRVSAPLWVGMLLFFLPLSTWALIASS